jgi:23S rRNA (cytidine2498-2'-O)-methyltransferase
MNGPPRGKVTPLQRIHLTHPGLEKTLLSELKRSLPNSRHAELYSGVVRSDVHHADAQINTTIAFASQTLAAAEEVSAATVSRWVQLLGDKIIQSLEGSENPWRLHIFPIQSQDGYVGERRCELIEQELYAYLERKQRRLLRTMNENSTSWWLPDETLVQLGMLTVDRGFLSCLSAIDRQRMQGALSILPAGALKIRDDKRPPSRAYRKLIEAQAHLGLAIGSGHQCVDLGASPGGWSWVALEQGASVIAVDRAPLRDDLMRHERIRFVQGDGFAFEPEGVVDWLLCDIIAFPERSIELIEAWVSKKLCRALVVTVKFRGSEDYERLEALKTFLRLPANRCVIRHLSSNKNEVTVAAQFESFPVVAVEPSASAG